ncbi:DUF551 domain-containing protein [Neisseria elongata]|uniref:DUF551 domain-containing protein n=1 Tax=Neisseria elongata TaxID=495 RepID=UPI0024B0E8FE|nr:DUF551 domain-containing protein [Neisseria elongata]
MNSRGDYNTLANPADLELIPHPDTARAKQSEWISVEERLPETEGYVIVAWANGYVELSRCTRDKYSHGGSWHPDFIPDDITHWQPLPKPPKGDSA